MLAAEWDFDHAFIFVRTHRMDGRRRRFRRARAQLLILRPPSKRRMQNERRFSFVWMCVPDSAGKRVSKPIGEVMNRKKE
jgi:hypothetical protein